MLQHSIRRSLRQHLAGLWVRGPVPEGPAVLASSHASWWDGYLLAELAWSAGQPCQVMITDEQLSRFPFLRRAGAVGQRNMRTLWRGLQAGGWAVIFPAGEIRHPSQVVPLQPGAAWLAERAGVPLVPVAARVVMRGGQWPEAFLRLGPPCPPPELEGALTRLAAALEYDLQQAPAEQPPAGYLCLMRGRAGRHERPDWPSRLLARLDRHGEGD